jgi:hypothetical protein
LEKIDNDDIMQQSYSEFILCLARVPAFPPGHGQELLQRGHALTRQLFLQGGHLFVRQLRVLLLLQAHRTQQTAARTVKGLSPGDHGTCMRFLVKRLADTVGKTKVAQWCAVAQLWCGVAQYNAA